MNWFDDKLRNNFSQYGEDGILEEIYRRLDVTEGFFVEFGAWDGKKYSNSYNLLENHGWTGVYIEGNAERFEELKRNLPQDSVLKICAYVQPDGPSSLDRLLSDRGVPDTISLLSIDIDSDDYAVWEGLNDYHPLAVAIEYNQTIPLDLAYVQPRGRNIGNSALAITALAEAKGYTLVAMTKTNLIFVRDDQFPKLGIEAPKLEQLSESIPKYRIFYGYDGSLVHTGPQRFTGNPWQQRLPGQVPKSFRYYGASGSWKDRCKPHVMRLLTRILG